MCIIRILNIFLFVSDRNEKPTKRNRAHKIISKNKIVKYSKHNSIHKAAQSYNVDRKI